MKFTYWFMQEQMGGRLGTSADVQMSNGQRRVHNESWGVIKPRNIEDHSCSSHNKAEEQAYITGKEHQSRRWDKWRYIKKMYPTGAGIPKCYGLPLLHKTGVPLRPIVSSRGTVFYETAKELASILKPLVGKSPYNVQNTRDFVQQMKNIQLQQHEYIISYNVKAIFTLVSIESAIEIIKKQLEDEKEVQQRTPMTVNHIICLLEFCLKNTYFISQGRHYEQVGGTAMCSPISPIVADLYMEAFEVQALNTAPHPPSLWRRFVADTFAVTQYAHEDSFIEHINSIDDRIQFTMEDCRSDGSMPFLVPLVIPQPDGSFSTTVYRKPTHNVSTVEQSPYHCS